MAFIYIAADISLGPEPYFKGFLNVKIDLVEILDTNNVTRRVIKFDEIIDFKKTEASFLLILADGFLITFTLT